LLAGMHAHVIELIHFNQARASREVLSNNGLQMLNPEYTVARLGTPVLQAREQSANNYRFKLNGGNYRAGTI